MTPGRLWVRGRRNIETSHFLPSLAVNLKLLLDVCLLRERKTLPRPSVLLGAHILQGQSAEIRSNSVHALQTWPTGAQHSDPEARLQALMPAPTHPGQPLLKGQHLRQACVLGLPHSLGGRGPKLPSVHPCGVWVGDCVSAELGWTSPGQKSCLSPVFSALEDGGPWGLPLRPLPSRAV